MDTGSTPVYSIENFQKAGDHMPGEKEMINNLIDTYSNLQQIKQANGDHKNQVLDYLIKVTVAKLSSMGINVEDITL